MTTVFIWLPGVPGGTEWFHGHVGHASVSVGGSYYSFWPGPSKTSDKLLPAVPTFHTFEEDLQAKGFAPDDQIDVPNLDEKSMEKFWLSVISSRFKYDFLQLNCCTTVAYSLRMGFLGNPASHQLLNPSRFSFHAIRLAGKLRNFLKWTEVTHGKQLQADYPISPRVVQHCAYMLCSALSQRN